MRRMGRLGLMSLLCLAGCQVTSFREGETRMRSVSVLWQRAIAEVEIPGKLVIRGVISASDADSVEAAARGAAAGL